MRKALAVSIAAIALAALVALLAADSRAGRAWLGERLARSLAEESGRSVSLEISTFRPLALWLEVAHLEIAGGSREAPPALSADGIVLDLRWRSLFARRIDASLISVSRLHLEADEWPPASPDRDPESRLSPGEVLSRLVVDHLRLENGSVRAGTRTARFDLALDEVALEAEHRPPGNGYRGLLEVGGGWVDIPERGRLPVSLAARFGLTPDGLEAEDLQVAVAGVEATGRAGWAFSTPSRFDAHLSLTLPVAELLPASAGNAGWRGALVATGRFEGTVEDHHLDFRLGSSDLVVSGVPVRELSGRLEGPLAGLRLVDLAIDLPGGRLTGQLVPETASSQLPALATLDLSSDVSQLCAEWRRVERAACPAGRLDGQLSARIEAATLEALSGELTVSAPALKLPSGASWGARGRAELAAGGPIVAALELTTAALALRTSGEVELDGRLDLTSEVRLDRLGEASRDLLALTHSLGWADLPDRRLLDPIGELTGSLSGSLRLAGTAASGWSGLEGRADLRLQAAAHPRTDSAPLDGRILAVLEDATLEVREIELEGGGTSLSAEGHVGLEVVRDLHARLAILDVGPTAAIAHQILSAGGTAEDWAKTVDWTGALTAEVRLTGPWRELSGDADLSVEGFAISELPLGQLEAHAVLTDGEIEADGLLSSPEGGRLHLEVASTPRLESGSLRLDAQRQSLRPWLALAGAGVEIGGRVDAEAEIAWPEWTGRGSLTLVEVPESGLPIEELSARATLSEGDLTLSQATLRAASGALRAEGALSTTGGSISVEGRAFELSSLLAALGEEPGLSGRLDFEGAVSGGLREPRLDATIRLSDTTMLDRTAPDLSGSLSADRGGLRLDLSGSSDGAPVHLVADLPFTPDTLWSFELRYPVRADLGRWLANPEATHDLLAEATLDLSLFLDRSRPERVTGLARLEEAALHAAGRTIRPQGGTIQIRLEGRELELDPALLTAEGTRLELAGGAALGKAGAIDLRARGTADLGLLAGWDARLRADGVATIDLQVGGTANAPTWQGVLSLDGSATVGHRDWPAALEGVRGTLTLTPDYWKLEGLDLAIGGGRVTGQGDGRLEAGALRDYRLEVEGSRVRLRYPEGFRSEFDATLSLARTAGDADTLSGRIQLLRGLWSEDFELERQMLRRVRDFEGTPSNGVTALDRLALDLQVQADDGLWLRNDLADIESRADLRIVGTLRRPLTTGRIEALEGGRATFRRVVYQVTRGSITYLGAQEPVLDLEGETTVGEYDVTLTVSGPLSAPTFELRSDPSLPTSDIVTLLVTGRTRDELAQGGGGLSEAEAASYLTSRLGEAILPELRRSLGLDELRVDPILVTEQADPAARITVGKALSNRATATYSREFGNGGADIYQLRYRLNEQWAVQGTRDDDGSVAGDLRFRRRLFTGGGDASQQASRTTAPRVEAVSLRVEGGEPEERLRALLGLAAGDRYRRARLLDGLDTIRGWYLGKGYPEVEIEHSVSETSGGARVEVTVRPGRKVDVEIRGFGHRKELAREVRVAWERSIFRDESVEEGRLAIEESLHGRGYPLATVVARQEPTAAGLRAIYEVDEGPRVRVAGIEIRGNETLDDERIRAQMLTHPHRFFDRAYLRRPLIREDVEAIIALYQSEGFLDVAVEASEEYSSSQSEATVVVAIEEGPRYRLGEVTLSGNESLAAASLLEASQMQSGDVFNPESRRSAEARLLEAYDAAGYSAAVVDSRLELRDSGEVDLELTVREGPRHHIESIEILGLVKTRERLVRRQIPLEPGEPASLQKLAKARYNLYRTGLFRSVDYEVIDTAEAGTQQVVFHLDEAPDLRLDGSLGADTEEGPRVGGEITQTNLFGRGLQASLGGRWSDREQRAQFVLREPRLPRTSSSGFLSLFWEEEDRESYRARRLGLGLRATRLWDAGRTALQWGYDLEDVRLVEDDLFNPSPVLRETASDLSLGSFSAGLSHDGRDAPFWPTRGWFARSEVRVFDEWLLSDTEFVRGFAQWNVYQPAFGHAVWAVGIRVGAAEPRSSDDQIPVSERFFLGGDSSLRGFATDSVIPVGFPGDVETARRIEESPGGNALFSVNQELLFPLWDPLHGVLFYDAGNLFWRLADFDPTRIRHAAGLGVRIRTPVGPLRLEYGWKLDRQEGESSGQFHFSIGVPF